MSLFPENGRPIKRRHVVLDDSKIKIPLDKGWKRQTNIHSYGRRGIVGEVWYFAPCGRKMKTIPDVMRVGVDCIQLVCCLHLRSRVLESLSEGSRHARNGKLSL